MFVSLLSTSLLVINTLARPKNFMATQLPVSVYKTGYNYCSTQLSQILNPHNIAEKKIQRNVQKLDLQISKNRPKNYTNGTQANDRMVKCANTQFHNNKGSTLFCPIAVLCAYSSAQRWSSGLQAADNWVPCFVQDYMCRVLAVGGVHPLPIPLPLVPLTLLQSLPCPSPIQLRGLQAL